MPDIRPTAALLLASTLICGLGACTTPAEEATPSPSAAEESPTEAEVEVPAEFSLPVGDDFVLDEPQEDESTTFDEDDERTYQHIRIAEDSPLLDYDASASYAPAETTWSLLAELPDADADAAMTTASRYVVETWMDSAVYAENDPEANLDWLEKNKELYVPNLRDDVREDISGGGGRFWMLGYNTDGEQDAESQEDDGDEESFRVGVAYEFAPTRWTDVRIDPELAIGAWNTDDPEMVYSYVRYHVEANALFLMPKDPEDPESPSVPTVKPLSANIGVDVTRASETGDWKVSGLYTDWSMTGKTPGALEHPYE